MCYLLWSPQRHAVTPVMTRRYGAMVERRNEGRERTYVPPTPEKVKPKGSRDNAVEMAAGGTHEREALDAQGEKMANPSRATDDPGRTDNPLGTGVGYAGEGSAAYGEQEKRMSTNNPNSPKRPDAANPSGTTPTRQQPEQQQQASSGQKPGAGGSGSQQSTGGMPPTQGTGSTPQSHMPRPSSAETGANHGTTSSPPPSSGTSGTEANRGTIGGTQDHGTIKIPQGQNISTQGHGPTPQAPPKADDTKSQVQEKASDAQHGMQEKVADGKGAPQDTTSDLKDQAQNKASDVKDAAQGKAGDLKDQAQEKAGDLRDGAQGKVSDLREQTQTRMTDVRGQAQDTLESVKANLQTRTDALKETFTGKTDQVSGTVSEKGDQAKQAANEKSTQAGEKLTGLADSLRDKTQTLDPDHPVANAATKAAGALEQTGAYLQQSTPDDWVGDLKQLISRKPVESVLVAAGLGYMAARAFRK